MPLLVALLALFSAFPVQSQPQLLFSGLPGQEKYHNPDLIHSFYQNRNMRPLWVRGQGDFQPRVEAVLKILEQSWTHGLNPAQYKVTDIAAMAQNLTSANVIELDALISDSVVHYIADLTSMRGPKGPGDRDVKFWRDPVAQPEILNILAAAGDPIAKVREAEPSYALYESLRQELIRLAALPEDDTKPVFIKGLLKPGRNHAEIPAIRAKFGLAQPSTNTQFYDDALAAQIIKLQKSYGLKADGVIGPKTLDQVNLTSRDKMKQIVANMERLRWVGHSRPDRYILVNIPSATLWAVEDNKVALEMPVIVGKTARPTNSFRTEISGVRFNPNWTVPPTIKRADFLPMLQQDPYVLTKRGIELVANGSTIDPGSVNWNTITSRQLHGIRMVQAPGDDNPLGKVRVIMENPYNIYLHDTNKREMFSEEERNLSSGCIRVSKPEELADFILQKNQDWSESQLRKMIDSGRMRDVKTQENLPVYIMYQTIWLDTEGRLVYGRDIYGEDAKLVKSLEKAGDVHIPAASEKQQISL